MGLSSVSNTILSRHSTIVRSGTDRAVATPGVGVLPIRGDEIAAEAEVTRSVLIYFVLPLACCGIRRPFMPSCITYRDDLRPKVVSDPSRNAGRGRDRGNCRHGVRD